MYRMLLPLFLTATLIGCGAERVKVVNEPTKPVPIKGNVEIINAPEVIISNDPSRPLTVSEVLTKIPYQTSAWSATSEDASQAIIRTEVPSQDKMFVIETITAHVRIQEGDEIGTMSVRAIINNKSVDHDIALTKHGVSKGIGGTRIDYTATHKVKLYNAPGKKVHFLYSKGKDAGSYNFRATVSGYLAPDEIAR